LLALIPRFDVLMSRYLSGATVPLLVVVAAGLGARRAGRVGTAIVVLLCVLGVAIDVGTAHVSKFEHEDWRGAAQAIDADGGPRAVVLSPSRGRVPFGVYRPQARPLTEPDAVVSEIVVVALPPAFRALGRPSRPPRPPSPAPASSFTQVERVETDSFTLVRYRATTPVRVDRSRLGAMRLGSDEPALLFEPSDH
ncbi:MAG TPA: hypothetical protein VKA21_04545, partial [Candidatus Binatia bacterium]|nr:hypothetical protein [Candidatus Binatia bacterium]